MSDQEHIMNTLKKDLRSLLIPVMEGLTLVQLEREYRSMIGRQIPFRALGYLSTLELILDIPDVVSVQPMRDGNINVKVVADEHTKDIMRLVGRKKANCKSQCSRRKSNFDCGSRLPQRPCVSQSVPHCDQAPPVLPAVVKSKVVIQSGKSKQRWIPMVSAPTWKECPTNDLVTVIQTPAPSYESEIPKSPMETPVVNNEEKIGQVSSIFSLQNINQGPSVEAIQRGQEANDQLENEMMTAATQKGGIVSSELKEKTRSLENEMMTAATQKGGIVSSELKGKTRSLENEMMTAATQKGGIVSSELKGKTRSLSALVNEMMTAATQKGGIVSSELKGKTRSLENEMMTAATQKGGIVSSELKGKTRSVSALENEMMTAATQKGGIVSSELKGKNRSVSALENEMMTAATQKGGIVSSELKGKTRSVSALENEMMTAATQKGGIVSSELKGKTRSLSALVNEMMTAATQKGGIVSSEPKGKTRSLENEMMTAATQKGGIVSSELKGKIRSIAAQHPEGLLLSKLPGEFEGLFQEALPIMQLGFPNLLELVSTLSDVLRLKCKGQQDWLVFDIDSWNRVDDDHANNNLSPSASLASGEALNDRELPCLTFPLEDSQKLETKKVTPYRDVEECCNMQDILKIECPSDAVPNKRLYGLPKLCNRNLVGVSVEHIISPSHFYIHIYGKVTSEKLEDMMIHMRICYSDQNVSDRYVIPPDASVYPGQLYCIKNVNDKWWYRVIIHRVLNAQEVEVFYPDFGNLWITKKSSLRFLKDCYTQLSAQAIHCTLAWTKPIKDEWSTSAITEFHRLCEPKLLIGEVDEYIDDVLYLFLCDTSTGDEIYLHDVLRLGGHALICRHDRPSKNMRAANPSALYLNPNSEVHGLDSALLPEGRTVRNHPGITKVVISYKKEAPLQDQEDLSSASGMPLPEPILSYSISHKDNWQSFEGLGNDDEACGEALPSHASADEDGSDEQQHSQELMQQQLEELYVTVDSQQVAESRQIDIEVKQSTTYDSQPLQSASALSVAGEAPPKEKMGATSLSKVVISYAPRCCCDQGTPEQNTLVFTTKLQGLPVFSVRYNPVAALGASARLAAPSTPLRYKCLWKKVKK